MHVFGGFGVDRTVHADYAAESGDGIAFESALVGLRESLAGGRAAGVGVLDDGADGFVEVVLVKFLCPVPGRLHIDEVVVGKFLALNLAGIGDASAVAVGIHRGLLVGVFAVAQVERFLK